MHITEFESKYLASIGLSSLEEDLDKKCCLDIDSDIVSMLMFVQKLRQYLMFST